MRRLAFGIALGLLALAPASWSQDGPPAIVALTLDTSGSIRPELIEQTRALAVSILESLPQGSEVALFVFDDTSRLILSRTRDPEAVRKALAAVQRAGTRTALYDALYDASRYLEQAPRSRKAIVLVTDGKDEHSTLLQEDGLKVATTHRIPVFAVGVGRVQESVLARIAKLTGGEFAPMAGADGPAMASRIAALDLSGPPPTPAPTEAPPVETAPESPPGFSRGLIALLVGTGLLLIAAAAMMVKRGRAAPPPAVKAEPRPRSAPAVKNEAADHTLMARRPDATSVDRTMVLRTQASLRVINGPSAGRVLTLGMGRTLTIGRAPTNDLELQDPAISGEHCRVKPEDGGYVVYDVESTNGTLVNGLPIDRHVLKPGDVISLGQVGITFSVD